MKKKLDKIEILRGDITKLDVDAIVNAANTTLLGGGGVDGAIHRAAGPELLEECRTLGGCQPGEAKLTKGYRLAARFVIHTVGPIWKGGKHAEPETLANCYRNSLQLAGKNRIKTVAFPAISCGAYGYPIPEAAQIALETTRDFLATDDKIEKVIFVLWGGDIYEAYRRLL
jgi:O-acetyl-ADP-ribose deacetylase